LWPPAIPGHRHLQQCWWILGSERLQEANTQGSIPHGHLTPPSGQATRCHLKPHRANIISHEVNLHRELAHLRSTSSRKNIYSPTQIHRKLWPRGRPRETDNKQKPISTPFLPHVQNLSKHIYKALAQYNIGNIHLLPLETHSILRQVRDSPGLKAQVVCKIMCKWRAIYIGKMSCIIKERQEKRQMHQTDLEIHHLWQGIQSSRTLDILKT
jgi:hypothetical protein